MTYRKEEHHEHVSESAHLTFDWLGSLDHYDADGTPDGYRECYCCREGEYELDVPHDDPDGWALYDPLGKEIEPCANLRRLVDLYVAKGEEGLDPESLVAVGLGWCETCGGYFVEGDVPQPMYGHTHKALKPLAVREMENWHRENGERVGAEVTAIYDPNTGQAEQPLTEAK